MLYERKVTVSLPRSTQWRRMGDRSN